MKNTLWIKKLGCFLMAAVIMTGALCGCGRNADGPAATESAVKTADIPVTKGEAAVQANAVFDEHADHNNALFAAKTAPKEATHFDFFITNTEAMQGFANGSSITTYQQVMQSVFEVATSQYQDVLSGHALSDESRADLIWEDQEMDYEFLRQIQSYGLYEGIAIPTTGVLPTLFRLNDTPFTGDGLTMLVSNFVEPGFDLSALSLGIEEYFDRYEESAACVIGFTSSFTGEFHIPRENMSKKSSTFVIQDQDASKGQVPFYIVLVGPEASVQSFSESLCKDLDNRNIGYSHGGMYTNSVYRQIVEKPLDFKIIGDRKAKKAHRNLLESYNTGLMTQHPDGYAFFTTYSGMETEDTGKVQMYDAAGEENSWIQSEAPEDMVSLSVSSQIALISANYAKNAEYTYEAELFVYNEATDSWEPTNKNAATKVHVTLQEEQGELVEMLYEEPNVILAPGVREMYLSAQLDFGDKGVLSRDQIYRLEVRLYLNRQNHNARSASTPEALIGMSISSDDYYREIRRLYSNNEGSQWKDRTPAYFPSISNALACTPELSAFLGRLAELETKYQHTEEVVVEYIDFVFNLYDESSKR